MNLQGTSGCKEPAPKSLSLSVGKGRGEMAGKEAPFNYLLSLFPWQWLRKRVRTFSVETNSGSHSPSPRPRWPCRPLCCLGTEAPGGGTRGPGLPAFLLSAARRGAGESVKPPPKDKVEGLWARRALPRPAGPMLEAQRPAASQDVAAGAVCLPYLSWRAAQRIGSFPA